MQARKGIQHVDAPAVQSSSSPGGQSGEAKAHSIGKEMYVADGDYMQDIEVNDLRNRYLLTKSSTQKMVNTQSHSTDSPDLPAVGVPILGWGPNLAHEISCLHTAR